MRGGLLPFSAMAADQVTEAKDRSTSFNLSPGSYFSSPGNAEIIMQATEGAQAACKYASAIEETLNEFSESAD